MNERVQFQWYLGARLAALLPYHADAAESGSRVCEWREVVPLTKAAFSLGCSLSLVNTAAAEEVLTDAASQSPWRVAFEKIVEDLDRRQYAIGSAAVVYESLFPEVKMNMYRYRPLLLTPEQCVTRIGQDVLLGLIFGVLHPQPAASMVQSWVHFGGKLTNLGRGVFRVDRIDNSPLLEGIEEAYERVQSLYAAWRCD